MCRREFPTDHLLPRRSLQPRRREQNGETTSPSDATKTTAMSNQVYGRSPRTIQRTENSHDTRPIQEHFTTRAALQQPSEPTNNVARGQRSTALGLARKRTNQRTNQRTNEATNQQTNKPIQPIANQQRRRTKRCEQTNEAMRTNERKKSTHDRTKSTNEVNNVNE